MNRANIEDIYPLSPVQQGMLFHCLYAPKSGVYFIQFACSIEGCLDTELFKQAWRTVIERHAVLRTGFMWEGLDQPLQVAHRQVALPWEEHDWSELPNDQADQRLESLLAEDRARGFDLACSPLMRLALIRLGDRKFRLVWSHHHIVLDGWSSALVLHEVLAGYDALAEGSSFASPRARPYRDYIAWLQGQDASRADEYWRTVLQGFRSPTSLGVDRTGSRGPDEGVVRQVHLSADLTARIQAFARRHQLTMNTMVQAAWALMLNRYSGDDDVVFGVTVSGRPPELAGADAMVGMFINTLPFRCRLADDDHVVPWLKAVQMAQAELMSHQASSLARVQGLSEIESGHGLFDSIVAFESYPVDDALRRTGELGLIRDLRGIERTNYPLCLVAVPGSELVLRFLYDGCRFGPTTIDRMGHHIERLLTGFVEAPDGRVRDVEMLGFQERRVLLEDFNATQAEHPGESRIQELFEAQVRRTPNAPALVWQGQSLSYAELDSRASQLARHLRSMGVGPERLVGVLCSRKTDMVVGLLGILKAGGAYVPLDPAYPQERLWFILEDTTAPVLLTQSDLLDRLPPGYSGQVVCLDRDRAAIAAQSAEYLVGDQARSSNLAYVIYTSGSTGRPKGVAIEHRSAVELLHWARRTYSDVELAGVLAATSICFDLSVFELFVPLSWGGTVILAENALALANLPDALKVTLVNTVPSAMAELVRLKAVPPAVRTVNLAGEPLTAQLVDSIYGLGTVAKVFDLYGPSEDTTYSTGALRERAGRVTIGRPISNTSVYILDRWRRPVPIGVVGEIYIRGSGLARGYLARPDLTAERFLPDPFSGESGSRMYRTGDLGRYALDGSIEFLGRMDHQVKIRGFRIELGEIEARLRENSQVAEVVVVARSDGDSEKSLAAYLVGREGASPDAAELRQFLKDRLPEYMIPAFFVVLGSMPRTANGKIDRKALPEPESTRSGDEAEYTAPRDEIERRIAEIWAGLLGVDRVSMHDSFFMLGGHSLLATRLTSRLREEFKIDLALRRVFETPTVAGQAEIVRAGVAGTESVEAVVSDFEEGRI